MAGDARTSVKKNVRNSQFGICSYCFKTYGELTVDHIVSKYRGGTNHQDNLAAACYDCNDKKGTKHLIIFLAEMNGCRRQRTTKMKRKIAEKKYKKQFAKGLNSLENVFGKINVENF